MAAELDPARVKSIYLALVSSMFDRGILPLGWARWTGQEFEVIDLPDIWDIVREELSTSEVTSHLEQ
jgi:hypothetical protein